MRLPLVYPILDTATLARRGVSPALAAEALIEGGARILQFRHKEHFTREMFETAKAISAMCRAADVEFVIDDRADIALLLNAGLHLGQDDLPPADARRIIGESALLGFSTHNEAQLKSAASDSVDYFAIGPIFATGSKDNPDAVLGLANLTLLNSLPDGRGSVTALSYRAATVNALSTLAPRERLPLVAIGGITRANARQVLAAGANSLAIIGDLYPPECTKQTLRERMEEWLKLVS